MAGGRSGNGRAYSTNNTDYKLLEEVGHGASATVYRAVYLPLNEIVAVKCLDLDRCNSNLDDIRREAQTMSLIDHPNVIKAHCSFVVDRNLWVVMPFMDQGSCLHLMKIAYPDGIEEDAIGSILKETLKALCYLHEQGKIHRDIKAGNVLLDGLGMVKLADFGVSACLLDSGDRQRSRNTFVGTPCWMAPEVLQPGAGYDSKADIWSFGITALELAHGHAPFSKYPPMKVLLMTIQNAPPGLNYDRDKKFSKSFKEMVGLCLSKEQTRRPSAEKLLKHPFFKNAKPPEVSVKKLFADLPPLWNRVKALQLKDAAQLALKKMPSAEQEALSQSAYKRGVSAWNFDLEDLKAQASVVPEFDLVSETRGENEGSKPRHDEANEEVQGFINTVPKETREKVPDRNIFNGANEDDSSLKSLVSCSQTPISEKDSAYAKIKMSKTQSGPITFGNVPVQTSSERIRNCERFDLESQSLPEKAKIELRKGPSFSGPLMIQNRASANSLSAPMKSSDEKAKANLVQIKGRFSVTSENLDIVKDIPLSAAQRRTTQTSPLKKSASVGEWTFDSKQMPIVQTTKELNNFPASTFIPQPQNGNLPTSVLVSHLQNLAQQTMLQQDLILSLLSSLQPAETPTDGVLNGKASSQPLYPENNGCVEHAAPEKERLLMTKICELQKKMSHLTDELNSERIKYTQLIQQLDLSVDQNVNGSGRDVGIEI